MKTPIVSSNNIKQSGPVAYVSTGFGSWSGH